MEGASARVVRVVRTADGRGHHGLVRIPASWLGFRPGTKVSLELRGGSILIRPEEASALPEER